MPCSPCGKRMRETLSGAGYAQKAGIWSDGEDHIPDAEVEKSPTRVLATRPHLYTRAGGLMFRDALGALIDSIDRRGTP
jgi:hypothetical protein